MITDNHPTPAEESYARLLEENWGSIPEAARALLREAWLTAYDQFMVHNTCNSVEEVNEAIERMNVAAADFADQDREFLAAVVGAMQAAADSLDPDDFETVVGYRTFRGHLHLYYTLGSDMIAYVLLDDKERGSGPFCWIEGRSS